MNANSNVAAVDQPSTGAVTPAQMIQTALERGATMETLGKLLDLQERWERNEARKAFVDAFAAFKKSPPDITKNRHVKFGNTEYDHATLDQVSDIVGRALAEHGISHRWDVEQDDKVIRVSCVLTHELGHSEQVSMSATADTTGSKNHIQAIGSATTYLQRYTLLMVAGIAARGQDDDGGRSESVSEQRAGDLEALAEEVGADKRKFLEYMRVSSFANIPAGEYENAVKALNVKRGAK